MIMSRLGPGLGSLTTASWLPIATCFSPVARWTTFGGRGERNSGDSPRMRRSRFGRTGRTTIWIIRFGGHGSPVSSRCVGTNAKRLQYRMFSPVAHSSAFRSPDRAHQNSSVSLLMTQSPGVPVAGQVGHPGNPLRLPIIVPGFVDEVEDFLPPKVLKYVPRPVVRGVVRGDHEIDAVVEVVEKVLRNDVGFILDE